MGADGTNPKGHEWFPVDTQSYSLECLQCGLYISVWEPPDENGLNEYDREVNADCPCHNPSRKALNHAKGRKAFERYGKAL